MILYRFQNGDELIQGNKALIITFSGKRDILSTSAFNGGIQKDLKWAFNHDCKENGEKNTPLKAPSYAEHMTIIAGELGLDQNYCCGLSTAADMENVAIKSESYEDLTVTAVVTGGIEINGGRVGDPSFWHESNGTSQSVQEPPPDSNCIHSPGTINIMLHIDASLPEGTMTRALVTCTEAKTAALQELLAPSLYSCGIATGSGTDGTVIISNSASPVYLTFAGKHSKLGELIGRTVMGAVKEALYRQTGLSASEQFDVFKRISRYGITRNSILSEYPDIHPEKLNALSSNSTLIVTTSLFVHLLDQLSWGLIEFSDVLPAAKSLLISAGMDTSVLTESSLGLAPLEFLLYTFKHGLISLL